MKYLLIYVVLVALIVSVIVLPAAATIVHKIFRHLQQKTKDSNEGDHPCGACVRWSECNGVDDECPRRKNHG